MKIGTANNPESRLRALKLSFTCSILKFEFESRHKANRIEANSHKEFTEYGLDKGVAEAFTRGLSKKRKDGTTIRMGCTEWFSINIYEDLINYLKLNFNLSPEQ